MKTILLIDDEGPLRLVYGASLREHGYQVIEADRGGAGLEMATQQLPDLILSDISMPGMSGEEVLKWIRQDPELNAKQVILMTGNGRCLPPRKAMEEGADDFLIKPINLDALNRCMEARLKRSQSHRRMDDSVMGRLQSPQKSNLPHEFFSRRRSNKLELFANSAAKNTNSRAWASSWCKNSPLETAPASRSKARPPKARRSKSPFKPIVPVPRPGDTSPQLKEIP